MPCVGLPARQPERGRIHTERLAEREQTTGKRAPRDQTHTHRGTGVWQTTAPGRHAVLKNGTHTTRLEILLHSCPNYPSKSRSIDGSGRGSFGSSLLRHALEQDCTGCHHLNMKSIRQHVLMTRATVVEREMKASLKCQYIMLFEFSIPASITYEYL